MQLEGKRIMLRPWKKTDAEAMYNLCKTEQFEESIGWERHKSVEDSLHRINTAFSMDGCYAIVLKTNLKVIGLINLRIGALGIYNVADNEAELDYWLDPKYLYESYAVDAINLILEHCFKDLGLRGVWCGYFIGNDDYFICQKECGFRYHHTEYDKYVLGFTEPKTINVAYILKEDFLKRT